jgi:hypothetical protein
MMSDLRQAWRMIGRMPVLSAVVIAGPWRVVSLLLTENLLAAPGMRYSLGPVRLAHLS